MSLSKSLHIFLVSQPKHMMLVLKTCAVPEGGDRGFGPPPPTLENYEKIGFPSNTGPDPLEKH